MLWARFSFKPVKAAAEPAAPALDCYEQESVSLLNDFYRFSWLIWCLIMPCVLEFKSLIWCSSTPSVMPRPRRKEGLSGSFSSVPASEACIASIIDVSLSLNELFLAIRFNVGDLLELGEATLLPLPDTMGTIF